MGERITGRQIAIALKGSWHAGRGLCFCPAHDDKKTASLSIRETPDRILLYCFAGCDYDDVVNALRARGLWPARDDDGYRARVSRPLNRAATFEAAPDEIAKRKAAREIWGHASPIADTEAAAYLAKRGIDIHHLPPTLRAVSELYHREAKRSYPALIGAIQDLAGQITAVQRIFVSDGKKAPVSPAKKTLGPMGTGAIRLGRAGRSLGIAEGIETGLSAQQRYHLPVWISCGAWRMGSIAVPVEVERIVLFSDNGREGRRAADKAAETFDAQGLDVEFLPPPDAFDDWNSFTQSQQGVLVR